MKYANTLSITLLVLLIMSCGARTVNTTSENAVSPSVNNALLSRNPRPNIAPMNGNASSFEEWKRLIRNRALSSGIRPDVFQEAENYMIFKPRIVSHDKNQAEFRLTTMDYVNRQVSPERIALGKDAIAQKSQFIHHLASQYQIDPAILLGIWGMETNYGHFMGGVNVFTAMSTLAYEGRRRDWAEKQLINALYILQNEPVRASQMEGSWAGGMGQTQFIPEMFNIYAVDYQHDGQKDVWGYVDALASTANFLRNEDMIANLTWGTEVRLPANFDHSEASRENFQPANYWIAKNVQPIGAKPIPQTEIAIYIPEGAGGRAFAITKNFQYIKRYNPSNAYALGVGLLGDKVLEYY